MNKLTRISMALAAAFVAMGVQAQDAQEPASRLKLSGFASVIAGKTISGSLGANYSGPTQLNGKDCSTCYTADWSYGGVYMDSATLGAESKAGIQANYQLTDKASLVAQLTTRGTQPNPDLTWAFLDYKLDANWQLQAGRKRIPLYFYSDFQDVGYAYPWVSVPPELYGWDAVNYNGASARYSGSLAGGVLNSSVFAGSEQVDNSLYNALWTGGRTQVKWDNLIGVDADWSKGPLTLRGVYLQNDVLTRNAAQGVDSNAKQTVAGFALNLDYDDWFLLSELTQLERSVASSSSSYSYKAPAMTVGVGARFGKWTPFANYAVYHEMSSDESVYAPVRYKTFTASVRYDWNSSTALKVQYDKHWDASSNWGGDAEIVRVSIDKLF